MTIYSKDDIQKTCKENNLILPWKKKDQTVSMRLLNHKLNSLQKILRQLQYIKNKIIRPINETNLKFNKTNLQLTIWSQRQELIWVYLHTYVCTYVYMYVYMCLKKHGYITRN